MENIDSFFSISQLLLFLGILLLVAEIIFFGFATFVLFFIGLSMIVVGALMSINVLPNDLMTAVFCVSVLSLLSAVILWKPLKKIQSNKTNKNIEVGLVGYRFSVDVDILANKPIKHFYSGIQWDVVSDKPIAKNTPIKVIQVEVGKLTVDPSE